MRIDSRLPRAVPFRCRRHPTTNFTRLRTRSSNPVPSSGESRANLNFNGESQEVKTVGDELAPKVRRPQNGGQLDAGPRAERERAAAAVKAWLLAQIEKK